MTMKKSLLSLAVAALFFGGASHAAVIKFEISGTYTQGSDSQDLVKTAISLGDAGYFLLDPGTSGAYFDFTMPSGTFSTVATSIQSYYFLQSYQAGTRISHANFGAHISNPYSPGYDWDTIMVQGSSLGAWATSHSGYLGFQTGASNFGYIEYDYTRSSSSATIKFLSGAYESEAGVGVSTPGIADVPEPSSIALLCLGGLGLAALRRKSAS